jgi:hypothetical protein
MKITLKHSLLFFVVFFVIPFIVEKLFESIPASFSVYIFIVGYLLGNTLGFREGDNSGYQKAHIEIEEAFEREDKYKQHVKHLEDMNKWGKEKLQQSLVKALREEDQIDKSEKEQTKLEGEQAKKLENAKTGEPITLTGYGVIDADGNDDGWRFIHKKDAEKHLKQQDKE